MLIESSPVLTCSCCPLFCSLAAFPAPRLGIILSSLGNGQSDKQTVPEVHVPLGTYPRIQTVFSMGLPIPSPEDFPDPGGRGSDAIDEIK